VNASTRISLTVAFAVAVVLAFSMGCAVKNGDPSGPADPRISGPVPGPIIEIINDGGNQIRVEVNQSPVDTAINAYRIDPRVLKPTLIAALLKTSTKDLTQQSFEMAVNIKFDDGSTLSVIRAADETLATQWICVDPEGIPHPLDPGGGDELPKCVNDGSKKVTEFKFGGVEGDFAILLTNIPSP